MVHTMRTLFVGLVLTSLAPVSHGAQGSVLIDAHERRLQPSDPGAEDDFGSAVALKDDLAVVGSHWDDNSKGINAGSVYVFEREASLWQQTDKLIAPNGAARDEFGFAVALEADTLVVSAALDDTAHFDAGSVYVFVRCGGAWVLQAQLLQPSGSGEFNNFGWSVAIHGGTIVVGSPHDDVGFAEAGSAWVFTRNSNGTPNDPCDDSWSVETPNGLHPSTPQAGAYYGTRVAIEGNRLVVGAAFENLPGGTDQGAAYVYERSGSTWSQTAKLVAGAGALSGDQFGTDLALEGNTLLVGATGDDAPEQDRGSVHAFEYLGGVWTSQILRASNGGTGHNFGRSIDVQGDRALIGAPGPLSGSVGYAYLFQRSGGVWVQDQIVTDCHADVDDAFGGRVALDGDTAFVGARLDDEVAWNGGTTSVYTVSEGEFERFGFGDGTATPCPCGNPSSQYLDQGCENSTGRGGKLSVTGTDSASADDLRLIACNLVPGNPSLLYSGPNRLNGGDGVVFGNGLRLVGGFITRLGLHTPDGNGRAVWGPGLGASSGWPVGSSLHFQVWYRDPFHACVDVFNLTNGLSVRFQP